MAGSGGEGAEFSGEGVDGEVVLELVSIVLMDVVGRPRGDGGSGERRSLAVLVPKSTIFVL